MEGSFLGDINMEMEQINKIKLSKEEAAELREKIRKEFKKKMLSYILAALGLIASLAWNDTAKALIESLFPNRKDTVFGHFIYSIIVTFIVVVESIYLSHVFKEEVIKEEAMKKTE